MDKLIELADQLGKAVSGSPQATNLRSVRKTLKADEKTMSLLKNYDTHAEKLSQLETTNKPIEVEDKRKLHDLHNELVSSDLFKNYTAAQVEYVDIMRKVNEAIRSHIAETEKGLAE